MRKKINVDFRSRWGGRRSLRPGGRARLGRVLVVAAVVGGGAPGWARPPKPRPLEVTAVEDLRFGTVAREGEGAGWVAVGPTGGGAAAVGGSLVGLGGESGPAVFAVVGEPYGVFQVGLPHRVRLDRRVIIKQFASTPEWSGVLDGSGRATVRVGGRLEVRNRRGAGSYTVPFQIHVNYQ